jgi:hypothetical protein
MASDLKHAERIHAELDGIPVVKADGCKTAKQFSAWTGEGIDFASTLPAT